MKGKTVCWVWTVVVALMLQVQLTYCRDQAVFCSVCRAVVEEISARISDVDPNKKVKVGSFRVDPKGNQKLQEVQYAKSDIHLTDVLEDVCEAMNDYAWVRLETTKQEGATRIKSRAGKDMDTSNARFNAARKETLKSYCEEVVDDHEEEIMSLFKQDTDDRAKETQLCMDVSEACTEEQLAEPTLKLEEQRPRPKITSFHKLEPDESEPEAIDGVESVTDVKDKIFETLNAKKRLEELAKMEEALENDSFKDEL